MSDLESRFCTISAMVMKDTERDGIFFNPQFKDNNYCATIGHQGLTEIH